jgi:hypothetical protein
MYIHVYIYTHNTQVHDIEVKMEEQTAVLTGQIAELESRANYISVIHVDYILLYFLSLYGQIKVTMCRGTYTPSSQYW